ncbi:S41 family peptidase [Maribacter halichondriae]|uniref:S41 family peptidase n=1 Tax=Maribacter halichondriae TaxID=2980554 RepID=UPI00235878D7|nr:S41 family peptidase [Maribacter sp. Hal144]
MKKYLLLFLAVGLVFNSCKKSDDEPFIKPVTQVPEPEPEAEPEPEPEPESIDPATVIVQNFMWQTMNAYYLWQGEMPDLADTRFPETDEGEAAYLEFLAAEPDPGKFFENKLLFSADRFSGYSENYKDLVNLFAGITKSNGLEFGLSLYGSGDDVLGFVNYIVKDSDASTKDIQRGDIFVGVNGTSLNLDNYIDLLFGDEDTYTLNMADVEDNTLVPNGKEIVLTKMEGLEEDPILVTNIVDQGGAKIGYLMYNQFVGGSGEALNQAFGEFVSAGVTDLVLDLRYNLGGSSHTSAVLASLISGRSASEIFYKDKYNAKIEAQLEPDDFLNYFLTTTGTIHGNSDTPLNTLNLNKVYVLATNRSASASELVMVGLEPYIDVVHIGTTTVGKNQGSNTFVDDPENGNFYNPDREGEINPNNQWAIQPIIVTAENSDGFSDYSSGLVPDIELAEDIINLGILGDPEEPLFARAIAEITGSTTKRGFIPEMPVDLVTSSKLQKPFADRLIVDKSAIGLKIKGNAASEQ